MDAGALRSGACIGSPVQLGSSEPKRAGPDEEGMRKAPPKLWTCPRCGHRFVTRNLWHSCGRYRLSDHFAGRDPVVRRIFRAWVALARSCGPVTVYPQKTRIVIMVRVRFAGAVTHRHWLDVSLWLTRRAAHPALTRVEQYGSDSFGHSFRLREPGQIDRELSSLMREAYAVGRQEHLAARRARRARRL